MNDKELAAANIILNLLNEGSGTVSHVGMLETPERYIKFLKEFSTPEPFVFKCFKNDGHDEMVIVKNIPFYSLCEHHLVPFFGTAAVAYIPNENLIIGISKLPRLVRMVSSRLQNQERIGTEIAAMLTEHLQPKGVAVLLTARHMCMEMRGIRAVGAETVTSTMTGCFKTDDKCRAEFLTLVK